MSRYISVFLLTISAAFLYGQLDSNSVTVTASRGISVPPDLALFDVAVTANSNATLNDVLAALQPLNLTAGDLGSVVNAFAGGDQLTLIWSFSFPSPLSNLKDTTARLTNLQKTIGQSNKNLGLSLSFSFTGSGISPQAQQAQPCVIADLVNDARAKATAITNASGRTLSSVLAVSSATAPVSGSSFVGTSPGCSITVKFALLGS
jgi:hypothetical protein